MSISSNLMQTKQTLSFLAIILIIVGFLLTLENLGIIKGISIHWPIFLIITGCGFVLLFFQKNQTDPVLLWLGAFIFLLGIFFYYLNFTSWRDLDTVWPVFLGLVGISFLSIGIIKKSLIFNFFAITFIALFLVFTLVFTVSMKLWPMSLVVFGASLLIMEYLRKKINMEEMKLK